MDLTLGDRARPLLEKHMALAGGRFRGVRASIVADPNPYFKLGGPGRPAGALLGDPAFVAGCDALAAHGLALDVWLLFHQLDDVARLAAQRPDLTIVVNHLATPIGAGPYRDRTEEVFALWRQGMQKVAAHPNVRMKVGALGMHLGGIPLFRTTQPADSAGLAAPWRPYIDGAVQILGPSRCMFESNYPADRPTCSYRTLWNAFKHAAAAYSESEKAALFAETAEHAYRI